MKEFNIKLPETPLKNSLGPETKEYIDQRFPLTNDDTLQEEYALKFITDSNFIDKINESSKSGEESLKEINEIMWKNYEELLKVRDYLHIQKDLNENTRKLIDKLEILEWGSLLEDRFKLQKSDISQEERYAFRKEQIKELKEQFNSIKGNELGSENIVEVFERYAELLNKNNHLCTILSKDSNEYNPELN